MGRRNNKPAPAKTAPKAAAAASLVAEQPPVVTPPPATVVDPAEASTNSELAEQAQSVQDAVADDETEIVAGDEAKRVTGTSRITGADGALKLPDPHLEEQDTAEDEDDERDPRDKQLGRKPEAKKPDPNKPRDCVVTAKHIKQTFARNAAQNRLSRLIELGRRNNDVKWLISECNRLDAALVKATTPITPVTATPPQEN